MVILNHSYRERRALNCEAMDKITIEVDPVGLMEVLRFLHEFPLEPSGMTQVLHAAREELYEQVLKKISMGMMEEIIAIDKVNELLGKVPPDATDDINTKNY